MFQKKQSGFTLAELLVAMGILGILASLTIPRFFPQAERARSSEAVSMLSAIRQGQESYRLETGAYLAIDDADPANVWAQIGMDSPNANPIYFTYEVVVNNGVNPPTFTATATRTATNATADDQGDTITLDNTGAFGGTHTFVPNIG